jgi:hypothetical protein
MERESHFRWWSYGESICSRPLAVSIRSTDDVDVVVELVSTGEFYALQEDLLALGFKHDTESHVISRFLLKGLKVDFMPTDPSILGFTNQWYSVGLKTAVDHTLREKESIRIFTTPYFIASKMEAFKTRGKGDVYASHDLEDIIFVLDNRDTIEEELSVADTSVKEYLRNEFDLLLKNSSFEEALIGHVEQSDQMNRKENIVRLLRSFIGY